MSNAPQLYTLYQQLLEQSQLMLRLARQGLWDDLITCETDYVNAVHSLARSLRNQPSSQMQEQLRPTLRVILDNESQVKTLLQARMDELAKLVGQSSMQKTVLSTYSNQGGHVLVPQSNLDSVSHLLANELSRFVRQAFLPYPILEFRDLMEMVHAQSNLTAMLSLVLPRWR
jgi:flagellar protein FliT